MLDALTDSLRSGAELTSDQIGLAVRCLIDPALAAESKAEFLRALADKGETAGEIGGFVRALRDLSAPPPIPEAFRREREIVDVCGTGGDRVGTFNISTTVALALAAGGVTVAKHGNRAVSSAAGSADVLEELGVPIDLDPGRAVASLIEHQFAFFFAPRYHPAFRHIAPARKLCAQRGQRTIFNLLGPLLNPARPSAQLVGVPSPAWCELFARALQELGVRRAVVVCGEISEAAGAGCFLDELSVLGSNHLAEFYQERGFSRSTIARESFPFQPARLADLAGGDRRRNAEILRAILAGKETGPKLEAVLLNAAAGFLAAGRARSLSEGWEQAAEAIRSGAAKRKLRELGSAKK